MNCDPVIGVYLEIEFVSWDLTLLKKVISNGEEGLCPRSPNQVYIGTDINKIALTEQVFEISGAGQQLSFSYPRKLCEKQKYTVPIRSLNIIVK